MGGKLYNVQSMRKKIQNTTAAISSLSRGGRMFMARGCARVAICSYTSTVCEIIQNNMKNEMAVSNPRHVITEDFYWEAKLFLFS
ncbi:unnamed protein product [Arctogadus glacialis]